MLFSLSGSCTVVDAVIAFVAVVAVIAVVAVVVAVVAVVAAVVVCGGDDVVAVDALFAAFSVDLLVIFRILRRAM